MYARARVDDRNTPWATFAAGLPRAGLPFEAAYQQALQGSGFATDCVLAGGRWYVYNVTPAS